MSAALGGLIAGTAATGQTTLLAVPLLLVVPVVFWKWPQAGPLTLLACATEIELNRYSIGTHPGAFTSRIPIFRSIGHTIILPIEGVMILGLLIWVMKGVVGKTLVLPRSELVRPLAVLWGFLVLGFLLGLSHGGKFNFALWELRPWIYLTVTYILASALLTTPAALRGVMWVFVLGTGFKALQGDEIFFAFARHMDPRPEAILDHVESFFFGVFIFLTLALWLFGQRGRLRVTATVLFPAVVIADLANSRRTATAILFVCLATLIVTTWVARPDKRRAVRRLLVVLAAISVFYFPAYWNHDGTLAQPARALRSAISPNRRDVASDLYRTQENANLVYNIQRSSKLGKGFGVPIDYALPITDISNIDPMIKYVPHNGLLWIWMRIGILGEAAFWVVIGTAIVKACRILRSDDKQIALVGALTTFALLAYMVQGYNDLGFDNLRLPIAIGCLLGCVEAATVLSTRRTSTTADHEEELATLVPDAGSHA
jgi:hypothetical protein